MLQVVLCSLGAKVQVRPREGSVSMTFIFVICVSINSKPAEFPEKPKASMPVEGFSNPIAT
jgi:hypothetical protein